MIKENLTVTVSAIDPRTKELSVIETGILPYYIGATIFLRDGSAVSLLHRNQLEVRSGDHVSHMEISLRDHCRGGGKLSRHTLLRVNLLENPIENQ